MHSSARKKKSLPRGLFFFFCRISDGWFSTASPCFTLLTFAPFMSVHARHCLSVNTQPEGRSRRTHSCSQPIKHTLNNLLWSLSIRVRAVDACVCATVLRSAWCMNFHPAKMMTRNSLALSTLKMNFWSLLYRLVICDIFGSYCVVKCLCSWFVPPHMAGEVFLRASMFLYYKEVDLCVHQICI